MGESLFQKLNNDETSKLKNDGKYKNLTELEIKNIGYIYLRPLNFGEINTILEIYSSPEEFQTAGAMKLIKKLILSPDSEEDKNKVINHLFMANPEDGALVLLSFIEKLENSRSTSIKEI